MCEEQFGGELEGRMRAMERGSGDGLWRRRGNGIHDEEKGKQKSTTIIGGSRTPNFGDKEASSP